MAQRGTILVAEDEGLARRTLVELLQEEGYHVYEAADGTAALNILDEVDVDIVLSDMAAHATGHRQTDHILVMTLAEAGLDFARQVLAPGGTYLAKVLRGGTEGEMLKQMKKDFASVRHVKPMSSRDDSAELFVLAMGFRG